MAVITSKKSLQKKIATLRANHKKIGFVPTMGALHQGHLSLVTIAALQNDVVVVSIFVNPTQFNNDADLQKYPRTLDADVSLLKTTNVNLIVFAPSARDFYDGNITSKNYSFGGLEFEMEGKHRKGHFNGVGTVVSMLLNAVMPDKAYFGEKDFQQLQIIKKLVEIEDIPVTIIGSPIVREENGLAMSSRNKRLSKKQFDEAAFIFQTLTEAKKKFNTESISKLTQWVHSQFANHPHLNLEYFEIANEKNLKTAYLKRKGNKYRGFIAVFTGDVRLIDNIALGTIIG